MLNLWAGQAYPVGQHEIAASALIARLAAEMHEALRAAASVTATDRSMSPPAEPGSG